MEDQLTEETASQLKQAEDYEYEQCAKDFFYFAQFLVTDDEERSKQRNFPIHFPHLHRVHRKVEEKNRIVIYKPRRMQISMYFCARMLWKAKFTKSPDVYYGGYSAMDEVLAIYQLGRISTLHQRLPPHIRDRNPMIKDNTLFKQFEDGGKIQGFPLKRIGEQGFGFSEYLFDEAAWQEAAAETYKGLIFSIGRGKIFIVSTPNGDEGTGKFFYDVWHCTNNRYQEYEHVELDSWECPEHDQEWHDARRSEVQPWEYAQMIEKSFVVVSGEPVFPEYEPLYHKSKDPLQFVEGSTVYICWDFGYNWPACVFLQKNTRDQWVILREFCGQSMDFGVFCKMALEAANSMYDRAKCQEIHCIDPAGFGRYSQKGKSGATCDAHEIRIRWDRANIDGEKAQIRPGEVQIGERNYEGPRVKAMRKLFILRDDKKYGIIIDPRCKTVSDGLAGGYIWDNFGKPVKNRYSHPIDAIQYGITAYDRMVNPNKKNRRSGRKLPPKIGRGTGM